MATFRWAVSQTLYPVMQSLPRIRVGFSVLGCLFALVFAGTASASTVTVSASAVAPTGDFFAYYNLGAYAGTGSATEGGRAWYNTSNDPVNYRHVGQLFQANATATLDTISLKVGSTSSVATNAAFTLTFYEFASTGGTDVASPTTRFTATGMLSATFSSGHYLTFDLSSAGFTMQEDKFYGFLLSFDEAASSRSVTFRSIDLPSGNSVIDRRIMIENGGALTGYDRQSLEFYVTTIPEPSNAGLLSGVVVCALWAGRRKRARSSVSLCLAQRHR